MERAQAQNDIEIQSVIFIQPFIGVVAVAVLGGIFYYYKCKERKMTRENQDESKQSQQTTANGRCTCTANSRRIGAATSRSTKLDTLKKNIL